MEAEWFAGRLRELREASGMTREQLAQVAGMKLGGIRDLEQGRRMPSWESVIALCKALKVNCDSFLQPPASPNPKPGPGRPRKPTPPDEVPTAADQAEGKPKQRKPRKQKARRPRGG
jgi:transcriptional regulator with XRE-family HTH domain